MRQVILEEGTPALLRELSEDEVKARYAGLVGKAMEAFRTDPQYLVEMVQQASILVYKKALWEAKSRTNGSVREEMDSAGVLIPMPGQRARRRSTG